MVAFAVFGVVAADFSIMRGFIYPRVIEIEYMRNAIASFSLNSGDTIYILRPNTLAFVCMVPAVAGLSLTLSYQLQMTMRIRGLRRLVMDSLGIDAGKYVIKFLPTHSTDPHDNFKPPTITDGFVIDMNKLAAVQQTYASYLRRQGSVSMWDLQ